MIYFWYGDDSSQSTVATTTAGVAVARKISNVIIGTKSAIIKKHYNYPMENLFKLLLNNEPVPSYGGITEFPFPDGFKDGAEEKLEKKRKSFYKKLADKFPNGMVYYPGSGADPIPYQAFGERIVYGSLDEVRYLDTFKNDDKKLGIAIDEKVKNTQDRDKLSAIYADIHKSPFPDKTFKIMIFNGIAVNFGDTLAEEIKRLLQDGGIVIYEDPSEEAKINEENVNYLMKVGFVPVDMDKDGGQTYVSYFGATGLHDSEGKEIYRGTNRENFLKKLKAGNPVRMKSHQFRVLQKV